MLTSNDGGDAARQSTPRPTSADALTSITACDAIQMNVVCKLEVAEFVGVCEAKE
jgi:hypothetical protein